MSLKKWGRNLLIVQTYVDDIIFGDTTDSLCEEFSKFIGSLIWKHQRGIIGSLLYLTASRSDIVFSVGLCTRFQSNSKESHPKAAKRILRYFKGTQNLVLYYPLGGNFNLIGYTDADYAGYLVNKKSTSEMAHFLGSCFSSWGIRKQNSVAFSIAEAEYVTAASCSFTLDQATIGRFLCIH
ncbi:secreted RxLR effector protein 161-like [Nicotiana sylvestris]|uniref:secreted RxLR effector protein 161-like n=1 Tax=Nicotiana sylvestris TaxID=4096 RepID=UPI00388C5097